MISAEVLTVGTAVQNDQERHVNKRGILYKWLACRPTHKCAVLHEWRSRYRKHDAQCIVNAYYNGISMHRRDRNERVTPHHLSRDARKPDFEGSDQVRHKPTCTVSEKG